MVKSAYEALRATSRDLAVDLLFRTGVTRPGLATRQALTVVTFHRVLPNHLLGAYPFRELAVGTDELEWFVRYFQAHYTCGTLAAMHARWAAGERAPRPLLALTFDDGQLDNFLHAAPILDRAEIKATFFVPTEAVDSSALLWHDRFCYAAHALLHARRSDALSALRELGDVDGATDDALVVRAIERAKALGPEARLDYVRRLEARADARAPSWDGMMGWEHLRALARTGHEVGSHSVSHAILTQLDDVQLEHEVRDSRSRLEAMLGAPCESFCYPNGDSDARVAGAVARAGYRRAVTCAWGPNHPPGDAMALRRCDMQGQHVRSHRGSLSEARLAFRVSRYFPGARA